MPRLAPRLLPLLLVFGGGCAIAVIGCFVDVDESLLDQDAGDADGGAHDADGLASEGGDAATPGMPCGAARCIPGELVCCASAFGETDRTEATCVPFRRRNSDCASGDWWECMSQEDCAAVGRPDLVCCAVLHTGGGFSKATCQDRCDAPGTILCDPRGACAGGRPCRASFEYPGLGECEP